MNDAAGTPPDAARTAIATINTQLVEMDRVEAGLQELEKTYANVVYPVATEQGMKDAKAARKALKDKRVAVEHARVAAKRPVLDLGNNIDGKANAIKSRISALENPIDQQITAQETKEAERRADLERRVQEVQNTPTMCIGKTAAQLQDVLDGINTLPLETFEEYRPQAAAAQESARQQVTLMLGQAKLAEEAAELRRQQEEETKRKAILQQRVDAIADPLHLPYRTSERVQQAIDRLTALPIGDDFAEFAPAAREKKVQVLQQLVDMRDAKKRAEDAAAAPAPTSAPVSIAVGGSTTGQAAALARSVGADIGLTHGEAAAVGESLRNAAKPSFSTQTVLLNTRGPMGMDDAPQETRSVDGLPSGARRIYPDEPRESYVRSAHDRANDEGAARLHEAFGPTDNDTKTGPAPANHAAQLAGYEYVTGTQARITPPDFDVVDAEVRKRPNDNELVDVIAAHYDVPRAVATQWLAEFDIFSVETA